MAVLMPWLAACNMGHTDGSEDEDHDPRHFERPTCTGVLHDAATNIIAARKDRSNSSNADPAQYSRKIEERRENKNSCIINDDVPMATEARRIKLLSSSTMKTTQARPTASSQAAWANGKAEPSRCHDRGPLGEAPMEQPMQMAQADRPKQERQQ